METKKHIVIIISTVVVTAVVLIMVIANSGKCKESGCNNKAIQGMDYCYLHKCALSDCNSSKFAYSNYCYSHYLLYDEDAESSYNPTIDSSGLEISDIELLTNSVSTVAEGIMTNNSNQTVTYVKIKGAFKDYSGKVIDTDWTYAVGSEGLAPGESCKWRMSVDKDHSICDCYVTILDFDY